jgi:hypothetical protein
MASGVREASGRRRSGEATGEHRSRLPLWLTVVGLAALALVLWGGYSHHWAWTGINGHTATLWDWLHLLLLPLAVAVLPIWMSRDAKMDPVIKRVALTAFGVFVLIVLGGYLIPWAWTGFVGNSLWDWLNLVALPVAVALTPLAIGIREVWTGRHTALVLVGAAVFAMFVLGGYLAHWAWTGFTGNTLWDWMHLLLLPLLLPILVVPMVVPMVKARVAPVEPGARDTAAGDPAVAGGDPAVAGGDPGVAGGGPAVPGGGPAVPGSGPPVPGGDPTAPEGDPPA